MEKEKEEKLKPDPSSGDSNLKYCPGCNSEMVWRIQRTEAEKMACFLSNGLYAAKKYVCQTCGGNTIMHAATLQYIAAPTANAEKEDVVPFISCKKCGSHMLALTKPESGADNNYFGKVSCGDCKDETAINRQDYVAFDGSSF